MRIMLEISYYPFKENFIEPIDYFINELKESGLEFKVGQMSTTINGDYQEIMNFLEEKLKKYLEKYPSVFVIKIANSCYVNY